MNNNKNKTSNKNTKSSKNKNGFTLIELLVVVLIIGILAAIALPMYKTAVIKTKISTLMQTAKTIQAAQERYYLINNEYTQDSSKLDVEGYPSSGAYLSFADFSCSLGDNRVVCSSYKSGSLRIAYATYYENPVSRIIWVHSENSSANKAAQELSGKSSYTVQEVPFVIGELLNGYYY